MTLKEIKIINLDDKQPYSYSIHENGKLNGKFELYSNELFLNGKLLAAAYYINGKCVKKELYVNGEYWTETSSKYSDDDENDNHRPRVNDRPQGNKFLYEPEEVFSILLFLLICAFLIYVLL